MTDNNNNIDNSPEQNEAEAHQQPQRQGLSINKARKRLNLHRMTIERAIKQGHLSTFQSHANNPLIPMDEIDALLQDSTLYEQVAASEQVQAQDVATAMGVKLGTARKRLRDMHVNHNKPVWSDIRGTWNLPQTLAEFRELVLQKRDERHAVRRARREEARRKKKQRIEAERQRRAELRAQLVASFPAWSEIDRSHQVMMLHIGPPNSGKTHDALNQLAEAGSGWYLAPLRLLAWEVFDRLNRRGVPCNLLTGEEYIPVEGAQITASTIEMFNPMNSGEVVIIDEAQMLADSDRGWAWTRAMMQCVAPEMHVIAPETAKMLIQKMAEAANISLGTVIHERLAPIKVSKKPWNLENMPPKTILVAFSRRNVLSLKTAMENYGREVSVVYGSLPPEVRRKQADRFANGETDICIATDAVGMGLNLPADNVCFYEVEKFDGRDMRVLRPAEVQQIGGRAGRYGISEAGQVGATSQHDLKIIRKLFYDTPDTLTHARVAPSVDDLQLIPGSLGEKLKEWSRLQSIPDSLRSAIKTANMAERIELANMLTDFQVAQLGLANAVQLVNAPTRKSTRMFWHDCAMAIIDRAPMPLPPAPSDEILEAGDLDYTESCISCADIYMWLAQRKEFMAYGEHVQLVRQDRQEWSDRVHDALLRKIQTAYRDDHFSI